MPGGFGGEGMGGFGEGPTAGERDFDPGGGNVGNRDADGGPESWQNTYDRYEPRPTSRRSYDDDDRRDWEQQPRQPIQTSTWGNTMRAYQLGNNLVDEFGRPVLPSGEALPVGRIGAPGAYGPQQQQMNPFLSWLASRGAPPMAQSGPRMPSFTPPQSASMGGLGSIVSPGFNPLQTPGYTSPVAGNQGLLDLIRNSTAMRMAAPRQTPMASQYPTSVPVMQPGGGDASGGLAALAGTAPAGGSAPSASPSQYPRAPFVSGMWNYMADFGNNAGGNIPYASQIRANAG